MEGSSKMDVVPPGLGGTSALTCSPSSDPLEKLHSHTDSFLTAARLIRGGWTNVDSSARRPLLSKSDGNQGLKHAEVLLKDSSRTTNEDRETLTEKEADDVKQMCEGVFSANRQREKPKVFVSFRVSRCRSTCRQSRRFKAPILPVIAEM